MLVGPSEESPNTLQIMNLTSLHTSPSWIQLTATGSLTYSFIYIGNAVEVTLAEPRSYNVVHNALKLSEEVLSPFLIDSTINKGAREFITI